MNSEIFNKVPPEDPEGKKNHGANALVMCNNGLVFWIFDSDLQGLMNWSLNYILQGKEIF